MNKYLSYYIDARAMGIFRILLAFTLLLDLWVYKIPNLSYIYEVDGVFDIYFHQKLFGVYGWSIFNLFPSNIWVYFFFLITALTYISILIGFKTRMALIIGYFCYWNIFQRAGDFVFGWDWYINVIFFWSIFLPLGIYYSLDSFRQNFKEEQNLNKKNSKACQIQNAATFAILLQISLIYFVNFIAKNGDLWMNGYAVQAVLLDSILSKTAASYLLAYPILCKILTYSTLIFEFLILIVIFSPIKTNICRIIASLFICLFHFGTFVFMDYGLFFPIAFSVSILLLPTQFWNYIEAYYFKLFQNKKKTNVAKSTFKIGYTGLINNQLHHTTQKSLYFLIAVLLIINIHDVLTEGHLKKYAENIGIKGIPLVEKLRKLNNSTFIQQKWILFAPNPPTNVGWIVLLVELDDGSLININTNKQLAKDIPKSQLKGIFKYISVKFRIFNDRINYALLNNQYQWLQHQTTNDYKASYALLANQWLQHEATKWQKLHPDKNIAKIELGQFAIDISKFSGTSKQKVKYETIYLFTYKR